MKRIGVVLVALVLLCCILGSCKKEELNSKDVKSKVELNVFCAAGLTESMSEIAKKYEAEKSIKVNLNFAASGQLQSQIEEGAPADIFISAALKQADELDKKGYILEGKRTNFLYNKIVLITQKENNLDITSFDELNSEKIKQIAIGDPKSVPVGQYAEEIFKYYGVLNEVSTKFNLATSVKEVLSWVETGNVDCGIVYLTDAKISTKVKVILDAAEESHSKVEYPLAILEQTKNKEEAIDFYEYLLSEETQKVFEGYGFLGK